MFYQILQLRAKGFQKSLNSDGCQRLIVLSYNNSQAANLHMTVIMAKLTLHVRTDDNLLDLLAKSESGAWVIAEDRVQRITHVQVINFVGSQMIEGIFDRSASYRKEDNRLVVKFLDGRIVNCNVQFVGQNPVRYI